MNVTKKNSGLPWKWSHTNQSSNRRTTVCHIVYVMYPNPATWRVYRVFVSHMQFMTNDKETYTVLSHCFCCGALLGFQTLSIYRHFHIHSFETFFFLSSEKRSVEMKTLNQFDIYSIVNWSLFFRYFHQESWQCEKCFVCDIIIFGISEVNGYIQSFEDYKHVFEL